jgi:hypothetical protein
MLLPEMWRMYDKLQNNITLLSLLTVMFSLATTKTGGCELDSSGFGQALVSTDMNI